MIHFPSQIHQRSKTIPNLGLLLALFATASAGNAQGPPNPPYGRVVDRAGHPIKGALIHLRGCADWKQSAPPDGITDGDGRYILSQVPEGPCIMSFSAPGFLPYEATNIYFSRMNSVQVDSRLMRQDEGDAAKETKSSNNAGHVELRGLIMDGSGAPVSGVTITIDPVFSGMKVPRKAVTDKNGVFTFRAAPGEYSIRPRGPTFGPEFAIIYFRQDETEEIPNHGQWGHF